MTRQLKQASQKYATLALGITLVNVDLRYLWQLSPHISVLCQNLRYQETLLGLFWQWSVAESSSYHLPLYLTTKTVMQHLHQKNYYKQQNGKSSNEKKHWNTKYKSKAIWITICPKVIFHLHILICTDTKIVVWIKFYNQFDNSD